MSSVDASLVLHGVAAASKVFLLVADRDDVVIWASRSVEEFLGIAAGSAVGRPALALATTDQSGVRPEQVEQVLAGAGAAAYLTTCKGADGHEVEVEVEIGPLEEDDRIVGTVTSFRELRADLGLHREVSRALARARAELEQAPSPLAVVGLDETVQSVNQAWCDLFDAEPDDFLGRHVLDLVHPLTLSLAERQVRRFREAHTEAVSLELVMMGPHGTTHPLVVEAAMLRDAAGDSYAVGVSARPIALDRAVEGRLLGQERLVRALARRSWEGVFVTDASLCIEYVAPSVEEVLGLPQDELVGRSVRSLMHPAEVAALEPALNRVAREPGRTERFTGRVRDASGGWRWIEQAATNCLADPDIRAVVWDVNDLTDEIRSAQDLRRSEALHRTIVENVEEGVLATSEAGETILVNDRLAELLALSPSELAESDPVELLRPPGSQSEEEAGTVRYELPVAPPHGGSERVLEVTRSPLHAVAPGEAGPGEESEILGALYVVVDVTAARQLEAELRHQALHDPLTGLPNRYLLVDRIAMAEARARRSEAPSTAMLFVDLDGFKLVNDRHGHQAGDELLTEVARRLQASVRGSDTVSRLGGDEFAVLCEDTGELGALLVAERIQDAMRAPVVTAGEVEHEVRLSIGVAVAPPADAGDLLKLADEAMYDAKHRGGGRTALTPLLR